MELERNAVCPGFLLSAELLEDSENFADTNPSLAQVCSFLGISSFNAGRADRVRLIGVWHARCKIPVDHEIQGK